MLCGHTYRIGETLIQCPESQTQWHSELLERLLGFLQSTFEASIFPEHFHSSQRWENPDCGWTHASPPLPATLLQGDKLQGTEPYESGCPRVAWGRSLRLQHSICY